MAHKSNCSKQRWKQSLQNAIGFNTIGRIPKPIKIQVGFVNYLDVIDMLILKLTTGKASNIFEQKMGRLVLPNIKSRSSEQTVAMVQKLTSKTNGTEWRTQKKVCMCMETWHAGEQGSGQSKPVKDAKVGSQDDSVSGKDACCQAQTGQPESDPQAHRVKEEATLKVDLCFTCMQWHIPPPTHTQSWGNWLAICEK